MREPGINAGARSLATRRTYIHGWQMFARWCPKYGIEEPLDTPPGTLMKYIDELQSEPRPRSPRTLLLRLQSIACHMRTSGRPDPFSDPSLRQLRTRLTRQSSTPKVWQPFCGADLQKAFRRPTVRLVEIRDRAMMLNIYVNSLAAQQTMRLNVSDVRFVDDGGVELTIGAKRVRVNPGTTNLCPVAALKAWINVTPVRNGPLFPRLLRSGKPRDAPAQPLTRQNIREVIRKYAKRIGINPAGMCSNSLLLGHDMDMNNTRALGL